MQFADHLTLDAPKRTRDGFLAVRAKAARTGVYDYSAAEVGGIERGFKASDTVKIYRPESEVFAADSVASFIAKPVTNNHPSVAVTADNWTDHARGVNMGALRDGDYLAFDLVIMDGALITDIEAGKRELSNGYSCSLDWGAGTTPDGMAYDATQRKIFGNHIAVVNKGRAGDECAIKATDSGGGNTFAVCDANPQAISGLSNEGYKMKITLDGVSVTLTDASEVQAAFNKIKDDSVKALDAANLAKATADAALVAKDAEIVKLTANLAANAITPAKLRDAAKEYAAVVDMAKAFGVDPDEDDNADMIKKKVVAKKMGDAAKDYNAETLDAVFAVLTKDVKANVVAIGHSAEVGDSLSVRDAARQEYIKSLNAKAA